MNITLLKTKECLQWTEDNYLNPGDMQITQDNGSTLTYKDLEGELCILRFGPNTISFDGQYFTFKEFLMDRLLCDEQTVESCLNQINLDF